jgi:hypothetical protein
MTISFYQRAGLACLSAGFAIASFASFSSAAAASEVFSFAKLEEQIKAHHVKSIEELLPLLPEQYRSKYALIYKSESAQGASAAEPRVILFGDSGPAHDPKPAQLIMAFTGSDRQAGGKILETIEFNPESKKFVFRSIDFRSGTPVIQENPKQCMACHSKSLHPNWDTYALWPGALGGHHLGHDEVYPDVEAMAGHRLLSKADKHKRYKYLVPEGSGKVLDPGKLLSTLDRNNTELAHLFTTYNSERVLAEMAQAPDFLKYEKVFVAAINNSPQFFSLLPDQDAAKQRYQTLKSDTEKKLESYYAERRDRYLKATGVHPTIDGLRFEFMKPELDTVTRLRLLAEDYLHIPTQDWALTRFPNTYAFMGPDQGIHTLGDVWSEKKPEFIRLHHQMQQMCSGNYRVTFN